LTAFGFSAPDKSPGPMPRAAARIAQRMIFADRVIGRRVLVVVGQVVGDPGNPGVQLAAAEFFGGARRRRLPTLSSSWYGRKRKGRFGFRDNLVNTDAGRRLDQVQTVVGDVDNGEISEDTFHAAFAGQR
jgi:hypothetical protein